MKLLLTIALLCASSAMAGNGYVGNPYFPRDQYVFTPEGTYTVSPQGTFTGGYQYGLPSVIVTDPRGNAHHGTRYSYGWSFSD